MQVMMGQVYEVPPFGKSDGGMIMRTIFEWFAPIYPADSFNLAVVIIGFKDETNGGIGGQELPTGEAYAVCTEVNSPCVVLS